MRSLTALCASVLFVVSATTYSVAIAQTVDGLISPQAPVAFEPIWMQFVCVDLEKCRGGEATMSGSTITVTRLITANLVEPAPNRVSVQLGRLPAGTYTVRVVNESGFERSSQALVVAPVNTIGPPLDSLTFPLVDYTDQWWSPIEPGWGMGITQHARNGLFAIFALYDAGNKPVWYTLQPGSWTSYNTYTGPVYKTTGPYFGSAGSGPAATEQQVGTATLTFSDPANGSLTATVEGVSLNKPIARLPF